MVELTSRIVLPAAAATAKVACGVPPLRASWSYGHWAIVLMLQGTGSVYHSGMRMRIEPDMLLMSPPGFVRVDAGPETRLQVITFEERAGADSAWQAFSVPVIRHVSPAERIAWMARLAHAEHRIDAQTLGDADVVELKRAFMENFWLVPRVASQRIVHDAVSHVRENLERIESLDRLAASLGYTRNHLSDLTRDLTGASLGSWLTGLRMSRARALLVADDVPIADVGTASGYEDAAYFSRAFRRYHGVPPQAWRIAHRPDDPRYALVVDSTMKSMDAMAAVA